MLKDTLEKNATAAANADALKVLRDKFAGCFTKEGAFDLKAFAARIRDLVAVTEEGYQLDFLGKNYARLLANEETETVIVPDAEHNAKPENAKSQNVYITGDNLDALKHLLKSYEREVKCIYIDPPYNTGSDGFVYNDNFKFKPEELARKLSITDEEAKKLLDFVGRGSASHSAWLMFMYPRLQLAKSLLRDDGVIFISIDDNEQANLKLLCDDIFGEQNFISQLIWESKYTVSNDARHISDQHEYVLFYARKADMFDIGRLERSEDQNADYKNRDGDPKGPWKPTPLHAKSGTESSRYDVTFDNGVSWHCPDGRFPRYSKARLLELFQNGELYFNSNGGVDKKTYLSEVSAKGVVPGSVLHYSKVGHSHGNNEELAALVGKGMFDNPKGTALLLHLMQLSNIKEDDIVLDFFSGSGTTAHACMLKSMQKACHWIMVQLPERFEEDSVAAKKGLKTIDELGQLRIVKSAETIKERSKTLDLGFKHFTLAKPSGEVLEKIESFDPKSSVLATQDMLNEFGVGTVLATWMNHDGYWLTREAEKVDLAGYEAYRCEHHLYLVNANFGAKQVKVLLEKYETDAAFTPDKIVLFGYSFGWKELEELDTNLKKLKTTRNITADLDIRY